MVKPLRPSEVTNAKEATLPAEVIECANRLIAENWDGRAAVFTLDALIKVIREAMDLDASGVDKRWLDIEPIYRGAGWRVVYDKPGWNETYPARFIFRKEDGDG